MGWGKVKWSRVASLSGVGLGGLDRTATDGVGGKGYKLEMLRKWDCSLWDVRVICVKSLC